MILHLYKILFTRFRRSHATRNTPKRIAFVANTAWSLYNFRIQVMRYFSDQGYEVYCLAPSDNYSHKLTAAGLRFVPIQLDNYGFNPLKDWRTIVQLWTLYRAYRFDVIFHYTIKINIYGALAASLARCTKRYIVITGLGKMFRFRKAWINRLATEMYRLACHVSTKTCFLNLHDANTFQQHKICTVDKCHILPSEGIDTQYFHTNQNHNPHRKIFRFLFAGRLLKEKGIREYVALARAIRQDHPHCKFEILGFVDAHNPQSMTLESLLQWQKKGWINYLGATEDIRPYLDRSDVVVLPSYYQEGISRILLEAAAMSKPIITTDHPGCREVVVHQRTGWLCRPSHCLADLISYATQALSLSAQDLQVMGILGRAHVKSNYDITQVIAHYEALIGPRGNVKTAISTKPITA